MPASRGVFPSPATFEFGGFWEASFLAGARAAVGTLAYVPPDLAGEVAVSFFAGRLSGLTPAEALRRAQPRPRPAYPDGMWVAHIIAGRADFTCRPGPAA
jgi:hypothetical protein